MDDRATWVERRPQPPDGLAPTAQPVFIVHLAKDGGAETVCGISVPVREASQVNFATVDDRNRCTGCELGGD